MSGWNGDSVLEPSANMPGFQGRKVTRTDGSTSGTPLLEALDCILPPARPTGKPCACPSRCPQNWWWCCGPRGQVEAGVLKPGMVAAFAAVSVTTEVKSVQTDREASSKALPGDSVGFNVKNASVKGVPRGGVADGSKNDPPLQAAGFTAQAIVMQHPGQIGAGWAPVPDCHPARSARLQVRGAGGEDRPSFWKTAGRFLKSGAAAVADTVPGKPVCGDSFSDDPPRGRFAVRDTRQTVAAGAIEVVDGKPAGAGRVTRSASVRFNGNSLTTVPSQNCETH